MKQTTKQTSKAKAAPKAKAAQQQAAKAAPLAYAAILADALAGKYGPVIMRFYVNAMAYHRKAATQFPRARIASAPLMNPADAVAFIESRKATSIPAGSLPGQRLFDQMMVESKAAK